MRGARVPSAGLQGREGGATDAPKFPILLFAGGHGNGRTHSQQAGHSSPSTELPELTSF